MSVAGGVDRVGLQAPHTARQAATRSRGRPAPVSRARPVKVPDMLLARGEAGVLDHGPGGGEPGQVAGLGQDRGGPDRGQPGDAR